MSVKHHTELLQDENVVDDVTTREETAIEVSEVTEEQLNPDRLAELKARMKATQNKGEEVPPRIVEPLLVIPVAPQ